MRRPAPSCRAGVTAWASAGAPAQVASQGTMAMLSSYRSSLKPRRSGSTAMPRLFAAHHDRVSAATWVVARVLNKLLLSLEPRKATP